MRVGESFTIRTTARTLSSDSATEGSMLKRGRRASEAALALLTSAFQARNGATATIGRRKHIRPATSGPRIVGVRNTAKPPPRETAIAAALTGHTAHTCPLAQGASTKDHGVGSVGGLTVGNVFVSRIHDVTALAIADASVG